MRIFEVRERFLEAHRRMLIALDEAVASRPELQPLRDAVGSYDDMVEATDATNAEWMTHMASGPGRARYDRITAAVKALMARLDP